MTRLPSELQPEPEEDDDGQSKMAAPMNTVKVSDVSSASAPLRALGDVMLCSVGSWCPSHPEAAERPVWCLSFLSTAAGRH